MVAVGDTLDGKYRLDERIGRGGFARVYRALDLALNRPVAVKVLNPELAEDDPTFLDRFAEEARHVAQLDHPNIVPVYVYGVVEGTAYLVMPLIVAGSLRDTLTRTGRLSQREASDYLAQAAAALDYAHARNIVHRDVKPENVLLRDDGRLVLSDFGLAKVVEETRQHTSRSLRGTPNYMAPEAWQGKAGRSADVYALGCVLFELLTGQPPYTGTMTQVFAAHTQGAIPTIAGRGQSAAPALDAVIARALAKQAQDRYPNAGALAQAVHEAIESQMPDQTATIPVLSPPATQVPTVPASTSRPVEGVMQRARIKATTPIEQGSLAPASASPLSPTQISPTKRVSNATLAAIALLFVLFASVVGSVVIFRPQLETTIPTATISAANSAPATSPSAPTPTARQITPTVPAVTVGPPRFSGQVLFDADTIADLDLVPPTGLANGTSTETGDFYLAISGGTTRMDVTARANIARWDNGGTATGAQCIEAIRLNSSSSVFVTYVGQSFCFITSEGRIAYIEVTGYFRETQGYWANVRIWEK
jgi:serine/threonine protein kinase